MGSITSWLQGLNGPLIYAVVAALVFCEDALFVGFVLPGETAVVIGGVLAHQGRVSIGWLCVVVVLAAVAGDTVGYEVGRHFGPSILRLGPLKNHQKRIGDAQSFIRRRGPSAVFLGRFIAFFRAMMPALAGISRMRYPVFLAFNALGGLVWGVGFALLGYFAGGAYHRIEKQVGTGAAIAVAVIVIGALVFWHIRRRRAERAEEQTPEPGPGAEAPPAAGTGATADAPRGDETPPAAAGAEAPPPAGARAEAEARPEAGAGTAAEAEPTSTREEETPGPGTSGRRGTNLDS